MQTQNKIEVKNRMDELISPFLEREERSWAWFARQLGMSQEMLRLYRNNSNQPPVAILINSATIIGLDDWRKFLIEVPTKE